MPGATKRRVVVTGLGACTPHGIGCGPFWAACLDGRRAIAPIPDHWHRYARYRSTVWAPLPAIDAAAHGFSGGETMRLDPATQLCLIAARESIANAGLACEPSQIKNAFTLSGVSPERIGAFIGNGAGGISSLLTCHVSHLLEGKKEPLKRLAASGAGSFADPAQGAVFEDLSREISAVPRYNPFIVSMQMANASAAQLGIRYALRGESSTVCLACASGTAAIGHAWRAISDGRLEMALAGGTEYLRDDYGSIFRAFDIARTLTEARDPCGAGGGPFDRGRSGFLFAEGGSAILIVEELGHALARGAAPIAEIIGFGEANDAYSIMAPDPEGAAMQRLIERVLAESALASEQIDYINAHGTGTIANDVVEARILARLFGRRPVVNSTKSLIGHTIGASGAIEAVTTCLSIAHGKIHPNAGLVDPIEDLDLPVVQRARRIEHALSLSFAFGGHDAALLLSAYHP